MNWDLNGNLKQRIDNKLPTAVTEEFFYDALNRFDYSTRKLGAGSPATNADVTLDAIGNISWKLGVGNYAYHATQKRAVVSAGSNSYGYDANGNMNSRNGASIGYTSYNLPTVINAPGNYSSTISYGAFRNRFKQVAVGPQGTETTIYVAGLLEKVSNAQGTHYRHYIRGGTGTAAIHSRTVGGSNATVYLHRDHLGSPELITDSSGNVLVRPSFAAYGERRDGSDWDGPPSSGDLATLAGISRRGFTGHEHLDSVGLIHMNGRVHEPAAGRFLGFDPIRIVGISQDANPYSYAWNSPLNVIDPSGWDEVCDPLCPVIFVGGDRESGGIPNVAIHDERRARAGEAGPGSRDGGGRSGAKKTQGEQDKEKEPEQLCSSGPSYMDRYVDFVSDNAFNVGPYAVALLGGLWPKSWAPAGSGRPPLLGSSNPLTSVPRAFGVPGADSALARTGAAGIGLLTVGIGFYNITIELSGFIYAIPSNETGSCPE